MGVSGGQSRTHGRTHGGALLGAHIRGFITDREIASIDEACELEDSSWLAVKPGERECFAPRPKLSREHNQRSDTGRVDEATVLEVEDNLTFRASQWQWRR